MKQKEIMRLAWQFVRDNEMSMSDAMECAWENHELVSLMRIGVVEFKFRKVDGSERLAHGTLLQNKIPTIKSNGRPPHKSVQVYFDTDAQEWRCFKKHQLVPMK
jgi:hypothetical protein